MANSSEMIKLLHITTVPESLFFLTGQTAYLNARGIEVCAISSPGRWLNRFAQTESVKVYPVEMTRQITPALDIIALLRLCRKMYQIKPDIVHAHTPKGGLLGILAAWLLRVPVRIFHIHGLPYTTSKGLKRLLQFWCAKISCMLAHQVLCVSNSVRKLAIAEFLCRDSKIKVLANGSINGVDSDGLFDPDKFGGETRKQIRLKHSIPIEALVLGYVGRIVREKGLGELIAAWAVLSQEYPMLHLLVVGPFEPQDALPLEAVNLLHRDPRIHLTGIDFNVPPLYAVMDLLALPSYREGFPVVPLEAAAMGLPVVATCIPGSIDAVQEGITGTLVKPGDASALANAIRTYLKDPKLRSSHGQAGRLRVLRYFRQEYIWKELYYNYVWLLTSIKVNRKRRRGYGG
jgi:glycosyltransferase involved in cell wall biosynthesis